MPTFEIARRNMVDCQLRTNKLVDEALIAAFSEIPREQFVPESMQAVAYMDEDVSIGNGRYLMEPMVLARVFQELAISPEDIVLDVGCGTGYSTAILSRLAATVVALESDHGLVERANDLLTSLSADNAVVVEGDLAAGHARQGPYDVIWVGGAVADVTFVETTDLALAEALAASVDDECFFRTGFLVAQLQEEVEKKAANEERHDGERDAEQQVHEILPRRRRETAH